MPAMPASKNAIHRYHQPRRAANTHPFGPLTIQPEKIPYSGEGQTMFTDRVAFQVTG
jgi:hypothetical protein